MTPTLLAAVTALLALALTVTLTPLVRGAALGAGIVAAVREDRWHSRPTPTVGGVAIFVGFGIAVLVATLLEPGLTQGLEAARTGILGWTAWEGLLAAGTVAFLVGLVDDVVGLTPMAKLGGQVVAAGILVMSGVGVWLTGLYAVDVALSLFWFVAVTNALNLLDNMDGLAAGVGAIAGLYLSLLFFLEGAPGLLALSLALSAALLGFLVHNYPPARIFMGDAGSHFTGIFLAGLALAPAPGASRGLAAVVAVPVLLLAIPLLDTALVTVTRVMEGRPIVEGGRDHLSHRIASLGIREERAVQVLWALAAAGGGVGLLLRTAGRPVAVLLGGGLVALLALVGAFALHIRVRGMAGEGASDAGLAAGSGESAGSEGSTGATPTLAERLLALHDRVPVLAFALDGALVALAWYAAYLIRWEPGRLATELEYFRYSLPVVIAAKLLVFVAVGIYGPRWRHFGLADAWGVVKANLAGSAVAALVLFLVARTGLSRGVLALDLLLCTAAIAASRLSFRTFEGAARRWSEEGQPVVVLGDLDRAELLLRVLPHLTEPRLRPVAVADPGAARPVGRLGGYPAFGGPEALGRALRATGAHAVTVVSGAGIPDLPAVLAGYLETEGAVDVYAVRVEAERVALETGAIVEAEEPTEPEEVEETVDGD